jgi:hypothetical protein
VVSLSFINNYKKTCDVAIVTDESIDPKNSPYAPLEAIARITQYAFDNMKMRKISGAGRFELRNWQQRMELFGYKVESVKLNENDMSKKINNTHYVSCIYTDYLKIKNNRSGALWDSLKKIKIRIRKLPNISYRDMLINFLEKEKKKYYDKLFRI